MNLYDNAGRIPRQAANGSLLALFVLALLSTIARFAVRVHYQRRFFWDDALLVFAILLLCTSLGLWFSFVDDMYFVQGLSLGYVSPDTNPASIVPKALRLHKLSDVALVLTWTSLNAIKFSFLFFFWTLTSPATKLRAYWWVAAGFTCLTWAGGVPLEIVACPYFDEKSLSCAQGDQYTKTIAIAGTLIAVNIASDLIILSIPVIILHNISVQIRTKIFLGMSLCLSVMTIIITIIRVAELRLPGLPVVDIVWQIYWQYVEVCIGVMIVSATAFRTFFVQHAARQSAKRFSPRDYFEQRFRQKLRNRSGETNDEDGFQLSNEIPGGTMTGLRTFIRNKDETRMDNTAENNPSSTSEDLMPLKSSKAISDPV